MSATPEQIAERLEALAKFEAKNAEDDRSDGYEFEAEIHEEAAALNSTAAALIRAQAERVRVLEAKLEKIAGEAPTKEPPNYATVGPMQVSHEFREYVAGMVEQAFHEGCTRALWEMGQIADAALKGEA